MAKTNDNSAVRVSTVKNCNNRRDIERSILSLISSARSCADDEPGDEDPLLLASSQINTDFVVAAQFERDEYLSIDNMDQGFFDLFRSPTYWKLRETFVEDAARGDEYAFMTAIWRAYNAGRVSPDRFISPSRQQRKKRLAMEVAGDIAHHLQKLQPERTEANNAH
jgi:hypothetical protein